MKIADMRPKVEFRIGDQVRVSGTHITGVINMIDCDHRLARLLSSIGGDRWFYLKDLELEKRSHAEARSTQRKPFDGTAKGATKINGLNADLILIDDLVYRASGDVELLRNQAMLAMDVNGFSYEYR